MNIVLQQFARSSLKRMISLCNKRQKDIFKRMYSYDDLSLSVNEVIDNISVDRLDIAMKQVARIVKQNKAK